MDWAWPFSPNLLAITYCHVIFQLLLGALIFVDAFVDEDWLDGGIAEDYAGREETVDHSESNLN